MFGLSTTTAYLSLGKIQRHCYLISAQSRQVVVRHEIFLELSYLLFGERGPLFAWFIAASRLR